MTQTGLLLALAWVLAMTPANAAVSKRCHSSITGKIVTKSYAAAHPDITYCSKRK